MIFDIDGTLLDSVDLHAEAWRLAFRDFGKFFSHQRIREQIGKGGDQLLPVFLSPEEVKSFGKQLTEHRAKLWKAQFMERVQPFPRVRELFEAVRSRGRQIALASSSKADELDFYKHRLKIADLLDAHTSSDDARKSKPHPDIFEATLAQLGTPADLAVIVGDSPYDAEAAGKAGIRSIGVLCGGFPQDWLKSAGFEKIFKNPAVLLAELDGWIVS